jgi:hypothetical protein
MGLDDRAGDREAEPAARASYGIRRNNRCCPTA